MDSLDTTRAQIAILALYLNKAEARDKICRAIQYGAKCVSGGEAGVAQQVDKTTSLARKVFRLLKSVNELQALLAPPPRGTPLPLVLLGKSRSSLMGSYFALDQVVWAGRTGIYKNKERTDLILKLSLYCFLGGVSCNSLLQLCELLRLLLDKEKHSNIKPSEREQHQKQVNDRLLNFIKSSLDVVVGVGLLQLAPKKVTPRVTGAFGLATSLIACYQLFPPSPKDKTK